MPCLTSHLVVLQLPKQWWIPAVAEPARREGNTRRFISLKEVIEIQLAADADTIWLPKYLLVLYQLSMCAQTPAVQPAFAAFTCSRATASHYEFTAQLAIVDIHCAQLFIIVNFQHAQLLML